jgi:hypothetical protein
MSPNAVDNLVQNYGFVMKHVKETHIATAHVSIPSFNNRIVTTNIGYDLPAIGHQFRSKEISETKMRMGGLTPFGPGVSPNGLSGRQASILAALGISRGSL